MYYFDNNFLKQYLEQGNSLQVYADQGYYTITDMSDLENSNFGVGYDPNGKPHIFSYKDIEQIKAGSHILTIDQLQDKVAGGAQDQEGGESPANDMEGGGEPPEMGGEAPEGGGEEMPKPPSGGAPEGGGGGEDSGLPEPAPPPEEEPEEEEPPREGYTYRDVLNTMLTESRKKKSTDDDIGFKEGDLVQNIDRTCDYLGSRGTVTDIIDADDDEGIPTIEYRIFNYGYHFKPSEKVTKLATQLRKIQDDD